MASDDLKRDLKQSFSNRPVGGAVEMCPNRGNLRLTVLDEAGALVSSGSWKLWKTIGGAASDPDRAGAVAGGKVLAEGVRPGGRCGLAWSDGGAADDVPFDTPVDGAFRRTVWLDIDKVPDELEAARRRLANLGYPEWLEVGDMIALFQNDYGITTTPETRGTLDAATKARLAEVHDDGAPR
jgi:hypothetical protein